MSVKKMAVILAVCSLFAGMTSLGFSSEARAAEVAMTASVNGSEKTTTILAEQEQAAEVKAEEKAEEKVEEPEKKIVINTASRGLYLYNKGVKTRLYPIAIGATASPTPSGYFKIIEKEVNPTWTDPKDPKKVVESGPGNPLGYRWMRIWGNYGIHGTNNEASIGTFVSNGCIRMRENDVEELFELVPMGTPVEISYNRVVVEKADDDTVVYYIYPDGYGIQPLDTAEVNKWLKGFGVNAFESDTAIAEKIKKSDGYPTFVAKSYEIVIDGTKVNGKAVIKEGITYLPAIPIAETAHIALGYNNGVLISEFGKVPGIVLKDELFLNADDSETLFHLAGGLSKKSYQMFTVVYETKAPSEDSIEVRHPWAVKE